MNPRMEVRASRRHQRADPPVNNNNNSSDPTNTDSSDSSDHSTATGSNSSFHNLTKMAFQLNVSLGLDEALARLQTYRTEELVCVVHDRSATAHQTINDEGLLAIFEALGGLPNLRSLRVDFVGRPLRIPVVALTVMLRRVARLSLLILEEVRLGGDEQEIQELALAIQEHGSLKEVYLHGCAAGSNVSLDPVISALARCPTVEEVLLRETRISPNSQPQNNNNQQFQNAAANLQNIQNNLHHLHPLAPPVNPPIQNIQNIIHPPNPLDPPPPILLNAAAGAPPPVVFDEIHRFHAPPVQLDPRGRAAGFGDDDDDGTTEANQWAGTSLSALCRSPSLRVLTLRDMSEINDGHIELMAEALCHNSTLRELTICCNHLGIRSGRAMGRVLQANRVLEKLEVQLDGGEHALPISDVLKRNSTLKRLDLFFNGPINPIIREAFTDMLRHNYVLLDLNGSVWRGQSNLEIDFYLRLNRAGRGDLLTEHATREQWVEALIIQQDDLSIVFSLLSMNPLICVPDQVSYQEQQERQQRRRSSSVVHSAAAGHGDMDGSNSAPLVNASGSSLHLRKRRKGEQS